MSLNTLVLACSARYTYILIICTDKNILPNNHSFSSKFRLAEKLLWLITFMFIYFQQRNQDQRWTALVSMDTSPRKKHVINFSSVLMDSTTWLHAQLDWSLTKKQVNYIHLSLTLNVLYSVFSSSCFRYLHMARWSTEKRMLFWRWVQMDFILFWNSKFLFRFQWKFKRAKEESLFLLGKHLGANFAIALYKWLSIS